MLDTSGKGIFYMDKSTKINLKRKLNVNELVGEKVMIDFDSGDSVVKVDMAWKI